MILDKRIEIDVSVVPVAQPRHRIGIVNSRAIAYGAKKTHPIHVFKAAVQAAVSEAMPGGPIKGAVGLELHFVMPRTKGQTWKKKPMRRLSHTKKPDIDNLCKGAMDAMTGIAWVDDTQVVSLLATKCIAAGDEQPRVQIVIVAKGWSKKQIPNNGRPAPPRAMTLSPGD